MGDHCAKCAPTVEMGREGWPVLVRSGSGYSWPSGRPAIEPQVSGAIAAFVDEPWFHAGDYPTAKDAADHIGARLPTEPTSASASADIHATVGGALDGVSIKETLGAPLDLGSAEDYEVSNVVDTRDAEIARLRADFDEVEKQRAYWQKQCEEARLRTPSPALLDILDLLDMAGKDHPAVAKLTAMARREVGL